MPQTPSMFTRSSRATMRGSIYKRDPVVKDMHVDVVYFYTHMHTCFVVNYC